MADPRPDRTGEARPARDWHDRLSGLDRRWIFLLMFFVVGLPLIWPVRLPLSIGSPARRFYEAIESVPAGSIVVMPMDYEPAFTAESHPMAVAVLRRLLTKNVRVIALTLQPAGPPMASRAWAEVGPPLGKKYGLDFVNLGYKSGNEVVILGIGSSIRGVFPTDTQGTPLAQLPLMNEIDRLGEAKLLIEIAATVAANIWVQQAQGRFHLPMVAGVTGVMAPEFFPYLQAGQVKGLLGGMAGAAEYETLVAHPGTATKGMDAQSLAHLLIVGLILLGNTLYYVGRRRARARGFHGLAIATVALGLFAAGCGGGGAQGKRSAAAPDTAREGSAFVQSFEDGPVDQIRVVRDTAGGIVVTGATGFPDGTMIGITLQRPRKGAGRAPATGAAPDAFEAVAVSSARVALGRFTSQPLVPVSGPAPTGLVRVRLLAPFGPGQQSDEVMNATARGRRFTGHGMHAVDEAYSVYETTVEVPL